MTENTEKNGERVAKLIRNLQAKTVENGCTEEEAMTAATKARELMDQYRLTMSDVEIQAEPVDGTEVVSGYNGTSPADYCRPGIMRYCGVRMWSMMQPRGELKRVQILGLKHDSEMAAWLYSMISLTIEAELQKVYKKTPEYRDLPAGLKRRATNSFIVGMAHRVNERLIEMAKALEPTAKTGTGTALVVVKNALVEDAFAKLSANWKWGRATGGISNRDSASFNAGRSAGDKVNLSRPVGSADTKRIGA